MKSNIKILVMDVDGTLTDGKIYMGNKIELFKAFNIKDGYGIKDLLPKLGIKPVIITARSSSILKNRCAELGIVYLFQNERDKFSKLTDFLNELSFDNKYEYKLNNVAYIGDDILDLQCMMLINKAGGITACPNDAVNDVKKISSYICRKNAGYGAVREFIEFLKDNIDHFFTIKSISEAGYKFVTDCFYKEEKAVGKYDLGGGSYALVQYYTTKYRKECRYESHKKFIDIQLILEGKEIISVSDINSLIEECHYDQDEDVIVYKRSDEGIDKLLQKGDFLIFKSKDAHMPCICVNECSTVRKIVLKIKRD